MTKYCKKCNMEKPINEFHKNSSSKDGLQHCCKVCNIKRVRKWQNDNPTEYEISWRRSAADREWVRVKARTYDIHVDDLQIILDKANAKCEICGEPGRRYLHIDHCHNTNKVRGILCEAHNLALGMFEDNIEHLQKAIEYLGKDSLEYRPYEGKKRRRRGGKLDENNNVVSRSTKKYYCKCGGEKSKNAKGCLKCYDKVKHKIVWPSPEDVLELVQRTNFAAAGRELGVTDNTVRKYLRKHKLII